MSNTKPVKEYKWPSVDELDALYAAVAASNLDSRLIIQLYDLIDNLRRGLMDRMAFVETMKKDVAKLDFLTNAARTLLLLDLEDFKLENDKEERRRIKDRLYRAVMGKPPEEDMAARRQASRDTLRAMGREYTKPEWKAPKAS